MKWCIGSFFLAAVLLIFVGISPVAEAGLCIGTLGECAATEAAADPVKIGLVPACPVGDAACDNAYAPQNYGTCEIVVLANNVLRFVIGLISLFATIIFVYAGYLLVASRGDVSQMQRAKEMFTNVLIGLVIMLSAFLIVNTVMSILVGSDSSLVNWSTIECSYQNKTGVAVRELPSVGANQNDISIIYTDAYTPVVIGDMPSAGGGGVGSSDGGSCRPEGLIVGNSCYAPNRCLVSVSSAVCNRLRPYESAIAAAASRYGVPVSRIKGVIITESAGNPNARSPVGAIGLMQIMPDTGRAACGLSAGELSDPAKNIDCGTRYYAQQLSSFGSHDLAAAAYNAGPGRNGPSRDCPGLRVWQCPFNSGGCCPAGKVTAKSCAINTGFQETRAYVDKVNSAAPVCR